jgi:TolA-binding protein|tara:strand:- start:130 stop:549 length:420 start_codon:yes stop_codon:yes gene_type:complete
MELFIYILSFISGGVVLTVAYNAYITTTIRFRYNSLLELQKDLEQVQRDQFAQTDKIIKDMTNHVNSIKLEMQNDNYSSLSELTNDIDNLKGSIGAIRNDIESDRKINEDEFRKVRSKIQSTVGKIQDQLNDKTMIGRY